MGMVCLIGFGNPAVLFCFYWLEVFARAAKSQARRQNHKASLNLWLPPFNNSRNK
jgi:hypothetical protein